MWRVIYPKIVVQVLNNVNDKSEDISILSKKINDILKLFINYVLSDETSLNILINSIIPQLENKSATTRSLTIEWFIFLIEKQENSLYKQSDEILIKIVKIIPQGENEVKYNL